MMHSKSLKYKLVRHLLCSQHNGGFILVEVIKVITGIAIIGVIAIIAFSPQCCGGQQHKNKQSMARNLLLKLNKAQQDFYSKKNTFSSDIASLGIGIGGSPVNFDYVIKTEKNVAFSYANSNGIALRSDVGAVFLVQTKKDEVTSLSIVCEANRAGAVQLPNPFLKDGKPTCPPDSQPVGN
jgi:type IV pilus assembly protein PilA